MIFDLYLVVSNFSVKHAHNFIRSVFLLLGILYRLCMYSLSSEKSESLDNESDASLFFLLSDAFYSYRFSFKINLLEFLSFDELDLFKNEYEDDGSGSESPVLCNYPFCSVKSVGGFIGVGSGLFVLTVIELIGDVFLLFVFVPR